MISPLRHCHFLLFIPLLLTLAACQQPTTYSPNLDPVAVEAERSVQRQMAAESEAERKHKSQTRRVDMEAQLIRVSGPVSAAGARLCAQIRPPGSRCVFDFAIEAAPEGSTAADGGGSINAYADGEKIYVTPGMMRFIKNDEELALILSHELAHNIMGHVASQRNNAIAGTIFGLAVDVLAASQGLDTQGGFTRLGSDIGVVTYSIEFEQEADYVGLYIMQQSGYNIKEALNFWRRFSAHAPEGISGGVTHPANPERFVAMQNTLDEIAYKRKHGVKLLPDFKPET